MLVTNIRVSLHRTLLFYLVILSEVDEVKTRKSGFNTEDSILYELFIVVG